MSIRNDMFTPSERRQYVTDSVIQIIEDSCAIIVHDTDEYFDNLGIDSVDKEDIRSFIEDHFDIDISDDAISNTDSVSDLIDVVVDLLD